MECYKLEGLMNNRGSIAAIACTSWFEDLISKLKDIRYEPWQIPETWK